MEKEEKRFNVEEHTTLDNKIIDVFPISHRYIHELETQLKKQKEINKKAIEYINQHWVIDDPVWFKNDLLEILEDKGE